MSKPEENGWTKEMRDINYSFRIHERMLLMIARLEIIPFEYAQILQRDFEQNYWNNIRDGE